MLKIKTTAMQLWAIGERATGATYKQCGKPIGVTGQAIKKRISRARAKILKQMSDEQRERYLGVLSAGRRRKLKIRPIQIDFSEK